jgi:hypothetical protein
MKDYTTKNTKNFSLYAAMGMMLILLILGCPDTKTKEVVIYNPCKSLTPDSANWSGTAMAVDQSALIKKNDDVAFRIIQDCELIPDSLINKCRCKLSVDTLQLLGDSTLPWNSMISATLRRRGNAGTMEDSIFTFVLRPTLLWEPHKVKFYSGSILSLDMGAMAAGFDPSVLSLLVGGLCIVENIDGSDGDTATR